MKLEKVKTKRRLHKGWKWLISTSVFVLIVLLGISYYIGWSLTHPTKLAVAAKPDSLQMSYEDIQFANSQDGTSLKGWHIPADDKDKLVIFAHGYSKNRSYEDATLPTAKALQEKGIASLLFDFRNSGESDGSLTTVGYYERSDLLAAVAYATDLGYEKIGVIGYSMGATTALVSAAETKILS